MPALPWSALILLPGLGAAGYLVFHHALLWLGRREDRLHALTLCWFLASFVFMVLALVHRLTADPWVAVVMFKGGLALSYVFAILIGALAHELTQTRPHPVVAVLFLASWCGLGALVAGTTLVAGEGAVLRTNAFGEAQYSQGYGPLLLPSALYAAVLLAWAAVHVARHYKEHREDLRALWVGLALAGILTAHDVLYQVGVINSVPLTELGAMGLGIGLTQLVSRRYNRLNTSLRVVVDERTEALRTANARLTAALAEAVSARSDSARMAAALENATDAVLITGQGGDVIHANRALRELGGPAGVRALARVVMSVAPGERGTVDVRDATGAERVLDVQATRVPGTDDPVVVFVCRDITDHRRMEAALVAQEKLASLGRVAAGIGHELNNPLSYVTNSMDALKRRLGPEAGHVSELVDDICMGAERMRVIIRDLRALARPGDDEKRAPVAVSAAVTSALRMAESHLSHCSVEQDLRGDPVVMGNESRLCQVLINLLVNAAQATQPGRATGNRVMVRARNQGDGTVLLEVEDNGTGIPDDVMPHIFEPFFTTRGVGGGTGLGLSICHNIVTGMGGSMAVRSRPGEGAVFQVILPAAAGDVARTPASAVLPGRRILLIDDDEVFARSVRRMLDDVEVVAVGDGARALDLLRGDHRFDLVMCDLTMRGMSGVDVYEHVRARDPRLLERLVLITGGAVTPRAQGFLAQVPCRRLEKPFGRHDVLELLAS